MQTTTFMKVISGLLMMVFFGTLHAQDIIITKDAQKIEAKILEVSSSEIKYKKQSNLEGPTFILGVEELNSIIYANGEVQVFNTQKEKTQDINDFIDSSLSNENNVKTGEYTLSNENKNIIYSAEQFQGGILPKFIYKKVLIPGKNRPVYRYVGDNLVFTVNEFLQFCRKYCREASINYWWGNPSQTLLIYNTNCAGHSTD